MWRLPPRQCAPWISIRWYSRCLPLCPWLLLLVRRPHQPPSLRARRRRFERVRAPPSHLARAPPQRLTISLSPPQLCPPRAHHRPAAQAGLRRRRASRTLRRRAVTAPVHSRQGRTLCSARTAAMTSPCSIVRHATRSSRLAGGFALRAGDKSRNKGRNSLLGTVPLARASAARYRPPTRSCEIAGEL